MNNSLVGKTILDMKIASDKKALLLVLSDNPEYIIRMDGDCCSSTWIEHIELPAMGFPCIVSSVEELPMSSKEESYSSIQMYGLKIVTNTGEIVIDYRNESNGYYGGNICFPEDEYYYGGVYGQNKSNNDWKDIE